MVIVVDTDIVSYLFLPSPYSKQAFGVVNFKYDKVLEMKVSVCGHIFGSMDIISM